MTAIQNYGPIGVLPTPSVSFQIERSYSAGLKVESVTFDVDDYFPGHNGFGGRAELLSGVKYPMCAQFELVTNAAAYTLPTERNPEDPSLVDCDARWTANDYLELQREWPALHTDWLEATVHGAPRVPEDYSFYDFTSQSFHEGAAVSFGGGDKLVLTPFSTSPGISSPAILAVFVLSLGSPAYELMTWKLGSRLIVVQVQPGNIVTSVTQDGEVASTSHITLTDSDIGVPAVVGLRYNTNELQLETLLKRGGKSNPTSWSVNRFPLSGFVACESEVLPGEWEKSVEVLDISVWRGDCSDDALTDALGGYAKGYGV